MAAGICHHPVEFRSSRSSAAEPVIGILPYDLESSVIRVSPKFMQLIFRMLVNG
jgi:hypothetical protein